MYTVKGKMSVFGGPHDTGMTGSEGLSVLDTVSQEPKLFLPQFQRKKGKALGHWLNPATYYIAVQWDRKRTPYSFLRRVTVTVTNAAGHSFEAHPVDWGPHKVTGRIADISPGLATALNLKTDDTVTVIVPEPTDGDPNA